MIDIKTDPKIPVGDVLIISVPPAHIYFDSMEDMLAWYEKHPERLAVIKNVGLPA